MRIGNLSNTSIEELVQCLSESFKGYFVSMTDSVSFWETRFENARVNWELSWGVFEEDKLVAFVVNAVDKELGELTAYNSGTGVLPDYRGNQFVDKIYEFGIPQLQEKGVRWCSLEVIEQNERAIKVYERIGFSKGQRLKCYRGSLESNQKAEIVSSSIQNVVNSKAERNYSWDNTSVTIKKAGDIYSVYEVFNVAGKKSGYFIIKSPNRVFGSTGISRKGLGNLVRRNSPSQSKHPHQQFAGSAP